MNKVYSRAECKKILKNIKKQNKSIGFVPTMGALHNGHMALIEQSRAQMDVTVVSIFVNPTQFNDKKDYENYPRNTEKDLQLLDEAGCDFVFLPEYEDIYSNNGRTHYDLLRLDGNMEGACRPGHFQGVAMVVDRLFEIIEPDQAFFGEKDFQQLQIIKHLVKSLNYNIEIVACPIIREEDGLAMSSRNQRLSEEERKAAPKIYESLQLSNQFAGKKPVNEVKEMVTTKINQTPPLHVEYFEIVEEDTLHEVKSWETSKNIRGCIAVNAGHIRLIDNIKISS